MNISLTLLFIAFVIGCIQEALNIEKPKEKQVKKAFFAGLITKVGGALVKKGIRFLGGGKKSGGGFTSLMANIKAHNASIGATSGATNGGGSNNTSKKDPQGKFLGFGKTWFQKNWGVLVGVGAIIITGAILLIKMPFGKKKRRR